MLSFDTLFHQLGHRAGARSLRAALRLHRGELTLAERPLPLTILTYNMALMVAPAGYVGPGSFRSLAIDELCKRIEALRPDVVGLCEVFSDGERNQISKRLSSILPHKMVGPDEDDLESDGGLLLLSKHPIQTKRSTIYRQCASSDCFANKGALFARIVPAGYPSAVDIFYTHAQAIYAGGEGRTELEKQLLHLGHFIRAHADPESPTFLAGDLNFPAEDTALYAKAMELLGRPIDLWLAQRPVPSSGATNVRDNNFYADPNDSSRPRVGQDYRLDYILHAPGLRHVPVLDGIEVLRWSRNGRQISDHFGVLARFAHALEVDVAIGGTIARVDAVIAAVRCIEETDEVGDDTVSFRLTMSSVNGSAVSVAPTRDKVATGKAWTVSGASVARLSGDPGAQVTLRIRGTEHDDLSANDSLGEQTLIVPRMLLLLHQGASFERVMPFLTDDGGEYAVTVRLTVV